MTKITPKGLKQEMIRLRQQGLTLREIGDCYRISRARVGQIIGNWGFFTQYDGREKLNNPEFIAGLRHLSDEEIANKYGWPVYIVGAARSGLERKQGMSAPTEKGFENEKIVENRLLSRGYSVYQYGVNHHGCDFIVNGVVHVDVKSRETYSTQRTDTGISKKLIKVRIRSKNARDLIIIYFKPTDDLFFVPINMVPPIGTPITFTWPKTKHGYPSKWLQYYERWDILDELIKTKCNL